MSLLSAGFAAPDDDSTAVAPGDFAKFAEDYGIDKRAIDGSLQMRLMLR